MQVRKKEGKNVRRRERTGKKKLFLPLPGHTIEEEED